MAELTGGDLTALLAKGDGCAGDLERNAHRPHHFEPQYIDHATACAMDLRTRAGEERARRPIRGVVSDPSIQATWAENANRCDTLAERIETALKPFVVEGASDPE